MWQGTAAPEIVVAATATSGLGQGEVAAAAARAPTAQRGEAAWAAMTVGLLPQSSTSNHSSKRTLLLFAGGGGPFPSYRAQNGPRGERAQLRPTT